VRYYPDGGNKRTGPGANCVAPGPRFGSDHLAVTLNFTVSLLLSTVALPR
jgi:hypothetical protein